MNHKLDRGSRKASRGWLVPAGLLMLALTAGAGFAQAPDLQISSLQAGQLGEVHIAQLAPQSGELWLAIAVHPQLLDLPTPVRMANVRVPAMWYRISFELASPEWRFVVPSYGAGANLFFRAISFDAANNTGTPSQIVSRVIDSPSGPPRGGLTFREGIPIRIRDRAGVVRTREPVVVGMPVARNEDLRDPSAQLKVVDAHGSQVKAQFRVAARWGDLFDTSKPVKWMHIDILANVGAGASTEYYVLRRDSRTFDYPSMRVIDGVSAVTIDTGEALFQISKTRGTLFESVFLDVNLDGELTTDEEVIAPGSASAAVITDIFGTKYSSANDRPEVAIVERGPTRTRIRVDGAHRNADPNAGLGRDYLRYTTWYDFYAGTSEVHIVHSLRNDYLERPIGSISFEDYRLVLDMNLSGVPDFSMPNNDSGGFLHGKAWPDHYNALYQEGNGNPASFQRHDPSLTMPGWELYRLRPGHAREVRGQGERARGVASIWGQRVGMACAVRHFWQNYQKVLAVRSPDRLEIGLWPEDKPGSHWIADYQQKTHEMTLVFFRSSRGDPAATVAAAQSKPIRPWCGSEYYIHTDAWGDSGDLPVPFEQPSQYRLLAEDYAHSNLAWISTNDDLGWLAFGGTWFAQWSGTSGSPRNKLERFDKWAATGEEEYFDPDEARALHASDVRRFHFQGFVASEHPQSLLWTGGPYYNLVPHPDNLNRSTIPSSYDPWKTPIASNDTTHDWNGYDYEHMTVDDIHQYYLLTNHPLMLRSLHQIGQGLLTFNEIRQASFAPLATRGLAWTMRGLLEIYEVTGEPSVHTGLLGYMDSWFTAGGKGDAPNAYVTRQPPHPGALGSIPPGSSPSQARRYYWDAPWQIGLVIHMLDRYYRQTGDPRAPGAIRDIADYLVDRCWKSSEMDFTKFLSVEDPGFYHGFDPYGLSTWIPGALAVAYRYHPRSRYLSCGETVFDRWTYGARTIDLNDANWHWWTAFIAVEREAGRIQ